MTVFFTSDTHFNHHNIIKHCNRPFNNVYEMNETMIANWNRVVQPNDTIYHLGDFSMRGSNITDKILVRLNGKKHLIKGNHDKKISHLWVSVSDVLKINLYNQDIWLSHYSHRVWPHSHRGSWHLFGHSHGKLPHNGLSFDVGVDMWNFKPVSFDEIHNKMILLAKV